GRPPGGRNVRGRYPGTTMGAMALFRQVLLDARWHESLHGWATRHPNDTRRIPFDRDLETVSRILAREIPVIFHANTENEIHRALNMAKEFELRPIISGGREAWRVADRLKAESVPLIVSLAFGDEPRKVKPIVEPTTQPHETSIKRLFGKKWQDRPFEPKRAVDERRRLWEEKVDNCLRLHEAGISFALASGEHETPNELFKNLRKAIERGLPEDAAVAALTQHAADLLGMSNVLGEIEPGKLANLTVLSGPLADEKSKVRWVFIDGHRHEYGLEGKKESKKEGSKDDDSDDDDDDVDDDESADASTTQPSTTTTSAPADETEGYPDWPVELESDRRMTFQTGGTVVLRNATILTVGRGRLEGADLLVENGKIAAAGANVPAPEGIMEIDLTGYVVCPGLIDAHSHMATSGGLNEFTLSVTPEVRVADVVNHRDTAMFRALAGGVTTIHTMHGSANTIGGQNVVLKLRYGRPASELIWRDAPQTMKWALGENVSQKHAARNRGTRFPNSRMGVQAVLRRSLDAASKYNDDWKQFREAARRGEDPRPIRRDLRLEALGAVLSGDIWIHCHCYRADEILQLLHTAESHGFRIGVLQHILEGYRLVPEIHRHGCSASTFSDWWAYKLEAYDAIPHNAARMVQGGIVSTVNSDSGEVVRHLNLEAAKSIAYGGLDETDALRLVTLNAAIQLGIDNHVGSIAIGKDADLAIFDGHPLDTFSKCVMTLVDGEVRFVHPEFDPVEPPSPKRQIMSFEGSRRETPAPPLSADEYALIGGIVHAVPGEPPVEGAVVLIRDGRVFVETPGTDAQDAESVIQIDGLHVYPGLIDAASSLGLVEIGRVTESVDSSEIGRFQPDLLVHRAINPHSELINVARIGGTTRALIIPGGGVVAGQAELIKLDGWTAPEMAAGSDRWLAVRLPSLGTNLPKDERSKQIDEHVRDIAKIERYFERARRYAELREADDLDDERRPPYDSRWEAMIPYVQGRRPILFSAQSYKQILEVLAFAERVAVNPIINGGRDAWKLADRLAAEGIPVIVHGSTTYPERPFGTFDSGYKNAAVLDEAGVTFCIARNSASNARQLGIEAGMAVAHGLDPDRAVYAITLGAARVLGVDDELGSLEDGKRADLIVTDGHPCRASTRVLYEFIDGRPVMLESRHTRWDRKFRDRPAPDLGPPPDLRGPPPMHLAG
ncbi:MAG: amidohydrolase family protein, partial [Planctomycetota bacterium]|nr:amidohydrolase family protein [Planctomycetota bacterium]